MAAPKNNLFAVGNNGGRPPLYDSAQRMYDKILEYIHWEDEQSKGKYTIEGCALFLGFATRDSFYDYIKKNEEFSYILNRFKMFMTHYHAQGLKWGGTFAGSAIWLKNFGGYSDESVLHQVQTITMVQPQVVDTGVPLAGSEKEVEQ